MAATRRRNSPGLTRLLQDKGYKFDFFQAVRLLQRERPDRDAVGTGDDPRREAVKFQSHVSLGFPPSDVVDIDPGQDGDGSSEMTVSFMGVASPLSYGSLPLPYTEMVLGQERNKDFALSRFLDLFNHRLISLFYRSWEKYRFAVAYERSPSGKKGVFEKAVFALMGLGSNELTGQLKMDEKALLARAYAVRGRSISAAGLAELIRNYFQIPVTVQQFFPWWYTIEDSERCRLGVSSCGLGLDIHLGRQVRLAQSRIRLKLGPLNWSQFQEFLPAGRGARPLAEMTALSVGPEFDFDCQLVLKASEAPGLRLGKGSGYGPPRLGWTTWLHCDHLQEDPEDVVVDGETMGKETLSPI
jgi:type VI secretion system protein ImpH